MSGSNPTPTPRHHAARRNRAAVAAQPRSRWLEAALLGAVGLGAVLAFAVPAKAQGVKVYVGPPAYDLYSRPSPIWGRPYVERRRIIDDYYIEEEVVVPRGRVPDRSYGALDVREVRETLADYGYRTTGPVTRRGDVYVATGVDRQGVRVQLRVGAYDGEIHDVSPLRTPSRSAALPERSPTQARPQARAEERARPAGPTQASPSVKPPAVVRTPPTPPVRPDSVASAPPKVEAEPRGAMASEPSPRMAEPTRGPATIPDVTVPDVPKIEIPPMQGLD